LRSSLDTEFVGRRSQTHFDEESNMQKLIAQVQRFLVIEDGPTAVEYAVLVGLIVVALVTVVNQMGSAVSTTYATVTSTLNAAS
jgi:pilus assembly protein Flp/PilA